MSNISNSLFTFRHFIKNRIINSKINNRIKKIFDFYEDFIGIKEVRETQENVLKIESEFVESSKARRDAHNSVNAMQDQLKQIRQKLDSTHRSDEAYLPLITKEHQLIKSEIQMNNSLRSLEEKERDLFSKFSQRLRDAHEVERLRQEKTKYLSVIGSIIGACLGIIATSINHAMKRKDFKELIKMLESHNLKNSINDSSSQVSISALDDDNIDSSSIANPIHYSVATQTINNNEDKLVEYISLTESNLEYKMKINSLTTVVATYALIAITLPIIVRLFTD